MPIHLFPARPGGLPFRPLPAGPPRIFLELVDAIQAGGIGGGRQGGADRKAVNRRVSRRERLQRRLIQVATGDDLHVRCSPVIQDPPHLPGMVGQVTAIEPHAFDGDSLLFQTGGQRHHLARRRLRVVGVEQEDDVPGLRGSKMLKRRDFVLMGQHERVGHRAVQGNAKEHACLHGGCPGKAGQVTRSGCEEPGFRPVGATQAEIHQRFPCGHEDRPSGLGRNEGLEVEEIDQSGLDQLRLRQRGGDPHDRLLREEDGPFRHCVHIAGEAQAFQVLHERAAEAAALGQPFQFFCRDVQVFQVVQQLF